MTQAMPQFGPGGPGFGAAASEAPASPSAMPPAAALSAGEGCGCGGAGAGAALPPMAAASTDSAPAMLPAAEGGAPAAIGAWVNNKRITALWSIHQNRNSWVHVDGVGWRKLANNSDSAIVTLTMLGAHAREKGSPVNYREEADGMIHEMYVW